jgi:hypothetical protein
MVEFMSKPEYSANVDQVVVKGPPVVGGTMNSNVVARFNVDNTAELV